MAYEMVNIVMARLLPIGKVAIIGIVFFAIVGLGLYYLLIIRRRKKWLIEIHEQKADGRIYTVGRDVLVERKLNYGTKTIYWLKRARSECMPPPDLTVNKFGKKEEVDYLRVERDMIPALRTLSTNYHDPRVKRIVIPIYDQILQRVRSVKTTYFHAEAVRERFIYIPIENTLTATVTFKPIPYDMNMMAINEIHNADEFFQSKYEWWKKYGAVIVFAATIVFLIILIVLTFGYVQDVIKQTIGAATSVTSSLDKIASAMGIGKPPT